MTLYYYYNISKIYLMGITITHSKNWKISTKNGESLQPLNRFCMYTTYLQSTPLMFFEMLDVSLFWNFHFSFWIEKTLLTMLYHIWESIGKICEHHNNVLEFAADASPCGCTVCIWRVSILSAHKYVPPSSCWNKSAHLFGSSVKNEIFREKLRFSAKKWDFQRKKYGFFGIFHPKTRIFSKNLTCSHLISICRVSCCSAQVSSRFRARSEHFQMRKSENPLKLAMFL